MFELATEHYREAQKHESALVCCLLLDRKLCRHVTVDATAIVDPFWRGILSRLLADPWISLRRIVDSATEAHAARTIADAIRCPIVGSDRVFAWNFHWHQHELRRLAAIRERFLSAVDCILEHGEWIE